VDQALYRVIRASPADQAPANRIQVNRIQASRNPVSLNQVNQIRIHRAAVNLIQATQATASPPAIATLVHLVAAIPARAIRAKATAASPIVQKVNRLVRKAAANLKASRIPKTRAVIATRYRVTRGQATRSQVIPVVAALRLRAFPAKATANRRANRKANPTASPKANRTVNRDPKANHQAVIVRKVDRVAIDQVTAKAIACHGQPVTQPVAPLVIRKAIQAADRQADLTVILHHQPAIREIHQPVTQMIRQLAIPQTHPPASLIVRA
jgi:hypothetical protein